MKKISIIVPVYNTEKYLERCFQSIIAQDYQNTEVIIVNDGSSDDSDLIIKKYVNEYHFIYISQENKGVGAARNAGISVATGDYITYIDSDDLIYPDYCSYLMNLIQDADIAIAGRENYVNDKYVKSKTAPCIMTVDRVEAIKYVIAGKYNTRPVWGKLYRRDVIEKIEFVAEHIFEDIRYTVDVMMKSKKVVFADKDLYSYRVREGSILTSDQERQVEDLTLALEYIHQVLIRENIYSCCEKEFKLWLAKVIIRNTKLFCDYRINA